MTRKRVVENFKSTVKKILSRSKKVACSDIEVNVTMPTVIWFMKEFALAWSGLEVGSRLSPTPSILDY